MLDIALALASAAAPAAQANPFVQEPAAQRVTLSAPQLLGWADTARARGDDATATRIYRVMQQDADPRVRAEARFRLAKLLAATGKRSDAATVLRQLLDDQPDATAARFALAQLLVGLGDEAAARRELRAIRASELPIEVARLVDRFSEALRVRKPFGASIELAMAPDSNINRATRSDTIGTVLGPFDIDDEGKAKSGVGVAARAQAYRRFDLGGEASFLARISGSADLYRDSDFSDWSLDAAVGPELRLGSNRLRLEAGASRRWFGGDKFVSSARVSAAVTRPLGSRTQVRLSGSASLIDNHVNELQDGKAYAGSLGIERALSPTTGVAFTIAGERQALADPAYSTRSWRTSLIGWRDIGRATVTAAFDYGRLKADDRLILFPDKRRETFTRLSLGATFRQLTFASFSPVLRYSIERNKSSIEFYDYGRRRTEVGIVRAF